ncbi:hypothetical protein GHT06_020446 [Daphnia sinensis]|uniref:Uncharacterized protein n=1 Tax=Daphnia sinensis TaxID=1820382 RepID=A0AAD5PPZ2_9CRUS|nr:hypothetical protein GHT06_020446 [Daphnia sinensis]
MLILLSHTSVVQVVTANKSCPTILCWPHSFQTSEISYCPATLVGQLSSRAVKLSAASSFLSNKSALAILFKTVLNPLQPHKPTSRRQTPGSFHHDRPSCSTTTGRALVLEEEDAASTTNQTEARAKEAKLKRRTLRQQITTTGKRIETLIYSRGSRGAILGLLRQCDELLLRGSLLQTEHLSALEDDEVAERQDNLHLTYVSRAREITEAAKVYLTSREGEAASGIEIVDNLPVAPTVPPPEIQRREQARLEELTIAQRRCDEARERANQVREECEAAQAALRQLTGRPTDPDQSSGE